MPAVGMREVAGPAMAAGRAVGAFNVILLEHAEAVVAGAEAAGAPVVLAVSENCVRYHGGLGALGAACVSLARGASVPVVLHLDHATSPGLVAEAASAGFGSVMFDASSLPYERNVAATAEVTRWCHDRDLWAEAELGEIGGKDGVHAPGVRTDPAAAERFVADCGVDALAVAVGSSHAMTSRTAELDLELIEAIHARVPVPLVLHGASGVPDADLAAAVRAGMTKVNIATHLNHAFTAALRQHLAEDSDVVDTRRYLGTARDAVAAEAARLLSLLALR